MNKYINIRLLQFSVYVGRILLVVSDFVGDQSPEMSSNTE